MPEVSYPLIEPHQITEAAPGLLPGEVRQLCYQSRNINLIHDVNLSLNCRGISVIMGANGAGKSLLLRLLHGMIEPHSGTILWGGQPLTTELRKRQAMVFQKPVLLRRSVAANIRFVLKLEQSNVPYNIEQRVQEVLTGVGLSDQAKQPARLLSGGEQQRLSLARALALNPEVLFLDEPTASLDPAATAAIESIISSASERGTRIVLITHDPGQARRLADEVIFLEHGTVVEQTTAKLFFNEPQSQAARDYLAGRLRF